MERKEVYEAIDTERQYQVLIEDRTTSHVVSEFPLSAGILAMEKLLNEARETWYYEKTPYPKTMELIRKIGGIVVNMGEKYSLPKRGY